MTERDAIRRPEIGLGMITPSGNVVVERVTIGILASFPTASAHFTRVGVTGSSDHYPVDYDWDGMLEAAQLLAHAAPRALCWNGSRGGSFGFDVDRRLCARITQATGLPCTTATLAIDAALGSCRRIGLVTPYRATYVAKLMQVFGASGYDVAAEAHADLDDNLGYAALPDDDIVAMVRTVAAAGVDAVVTFCTNLPAAHLADPMERELGLPVFDSTSAAVWAALRLAGVPTAPGRGWGSLFERDDEL
jgi:maleate isomerase